MTHVDPEPEARPWLRRGLGLAVWTLLGLCEFGQICASRVAGHRPVDWPHALALGLGLWYAWAVVWLLACRLIRALPLEPHNWRRRLAVYLAAGPVLALAKLVLDYPTIKAFYCPDPASLRFPVYYRMGLSGYFFPYLLTSWAMLGVGQALNACRKAWERGLLAARLEARLARAQLQALRMQLGPHFLCNTLNTISALIHTDADLADRMVARLGDLLRLTLEQFRVEETPLRREMRLLDAYLEIERARFGERLHVEVDVEPGAQAVMLPCLLLQPLVENALRHGVGRKVGAGRVVVRARRDGPRLHLEVEDDGPGLPGSLTEGVGLGTTRDRLRRLYGDEHALMLRPGAAGGVCVTVELPWRRAGERPAEAARPAEEARR
jgi:two-component sensor histidine kinase